jgi:hypothetical protein
MISIFISSISSHTLNDGSVVYYFHGDGTGEFEKMSTKTNAKVIQDYIEHLESQMLSAKHCLVKLEDKI